MGKGEWKVSSDQRLGKRKDCESESRIFRGCGKHSGVILSINDPLSTSFKASGGRGWFATVTDTPLQGRRIRPNKKGSLSAP
jgi:hypothetical protein